MATGWRNNEEEASYSVNAPLCEVIPIYYLTVSLLFPVRRGMRPVSGA